VILKNISISSFAHYVTISVVHTEGSSAATKAVALRSEVLSIAGAAEHLAVVLCDAATVHQLSAHCWKELDVSLHLFNELRKRRVCFECWDFNSLSNCF